MWGKRGRLSSSDVLSAWVTALAYNLMGGVGVGGMWQMHLRENNIDCLRCLISTWIKETTEFRLYWSRHKYLDLKKSPCSEKAAVSLACVEPLSHPPSVCVDHLPSSSVVWPGGGPGEVERLSGGHTGSRGSSASLRHWFIGQFHSSVLSNGTG